MQRPCSLILQIWLPILFKPKSFIKSHKLLRHIFLHLWYSFYTFLCLMFVIFMNEFDEIKSYDFLHVLRWLFWIICLLLWRRCYHFLFLIGPHFWWTAWKSNLRTWRFGIIPSSNFRNVGFVRSFLLKLGFWRLLHYFYSTLRVHNSLFGIHFLANIWCFLWGASSRPLTKTRQTFNQLCMILSRTTNPCGLTFVITLFYNLL